MAHLVLEVRFELLDCIIILTVCVFTPSGNFITLSILLTTELGLSHSFCQMLVALLFSDSICIIMTFMLFSLPHLTTVSPYVVPICLPIAQVALTMSVYMIIVLSLERFLVVSRPQYQVNDYWCETL